MTSLYWLEAKLQWSELSTSLTDSSFKLSYLIYTEIYYFHAKQLPNFLFLDNHVLKLLHLFHVSFQNKFNAW